MYRDKQLTYLKLNVQLGAPSWVDHDFIIVQPKGLAIADLQDTSVRSVASRAGTTLDDGTGDDREQSSRCDEVVEHRGRLCRMVQSVDRGEVIY